MSLSLEYLRRSAAETGFQASALDKVARLGEMAADVGRHPFLGDVLILKGGTALNLCFGKPDRLSVDLDFNYIGQAEREKMLEDRPLVETALEELARKRGYRAQKSADAFAGRKFYLNYRSVLGPEDRIEIDLNFLFRVPLAGIETRELWQPGDLERPSVRMVGQDELFLGKLLAFLERGAARDAWDVAHLPERAASRLTAERFRKFFMALSVVLERPLLSYSRERLERRITDQAFTEQVGPLLNGRIDFAARDLVEKAWAIIGGFLELSDKETEFFRSLERGDLRLELIFPDDQAEAERWAGHPAIKWKMANVRKHLAKAKY